MKPVKILIVCGTSIATATLGAALIREEFEKRKIPLNIKQDKVLDMKSSINSYNPDLVIAMAHTDEDINIPKINGMPLLTKIGLDTFWEEMFTIVKELEKKGE
jgi:PTS system galactitol-specific IIB component